MMYDHEKSDPGHSSCEADEQSRATGCGAGGARGECETAKQGPGTVPGDRVTGAGAHTEFRENITTRRYIPEVGAVCPNWARTDLMAWTGRAHSALWLKEGGSAIHAVPRTEAPSAAA